LALETIHAPVLLRSQVILNINKMLRRVSHQVDLDLMAGSCTLQ
jgi:hypothetical protein